MLYMKGPPFPARQAKEATTTTTVDLKGDGVRRGKVQGCTGMSRGAIRRAGRRRWIAVPQDAIVRMTKVARARRKRGKRSQMDLAGSTVKTRR